MKRDFLSRAKCGKAMCQEPDTLEGILLGLKEEESLFSSQRTIVMDAGIATEDNIALIKKNGFKYIAVSRKRTYDEALWSGVQEEKVALSEGKTILSMKLARTEEEVFLFSYYFIRHTAHLSAIALFCQFDLNRKKEFQYALLFNFLYCYLINSSTSLVLSNIIPGSYQYIHTVEFNYQSGI
ncbi:hypothetical protein [Candidatus Scalindua japonica]|uniref:hypothetical protein n=1 Tax=Candidatus Scalindua japonica TaxID=1284222 RepID=UPI000BDF65A2|nr:hypothetical protein [Candidatus Scalindua japonica]